MWERIGPPHWTEVSPGIWRNNSFRSAVELEERLTVDEALARNCARRIVAEAKARGETWPVRDVARFVREAHPQIPEQIALDQAEYVRE